MAGTPESMAPKVVKSGARVDVHDLSTADASGWRGTLPVVINALQAKYVDEYGQSISRRVRVLAQNADGEAYQKDGHGKDCF